MLARKKLSVTHDRKLHQLASILSSDVIKQRFIVLIKINSKKYVWTGKEE